MRDFPIWWLTSRATGIVGYLAITGSIVAGLASKARLGQRATSPIARLEWHKSLGIVGMVLIVAHVFTLLGSARGFDVGDLLVPGAMDYRPFWVALGVIAFWLLIVVAITGSMRARLGAGMWKTIHMSSYVVFVAATLHGLVAGTDSGRLPLLAMYIAAGAGVAALATRRVIAPPAPVRKVARTPREATPETIAADLLGMAGSCLVSMGGDIAVRGSLDGEPWPIEVQHGDGTAVIGLTRGGMATSGTDRRRWRRDGKDMHHVIDPATGRPSDTDLVRVTTVAEDAAHAEVWATALLVSGSGAAADEADRMGMPAVLVAADGHTTSAGGLE